MTPRTKITGWAAAHLTNDVRCLTLVSAKDRTEAVEKLRAVGGTIIDESEVKPATLLPGHGWFPGVPEYPLASAAECKAEQP